MFRLDLLLQVSDLPEDCSRVLDSLDQMVTVLVQSSQVLVGFTDGLVFLGVLRETNTCSVVDFQTV